MLQPVAKKNYKKNYRAIYIINVNIHKHYTASRYDNICTIFDIPGNIYIYIPGEELDIEYS